jgi:predicted helicase
MQPYQEYLKTLKHNLAHGDSTEHTHRAALQTLLKAIAPDVDSVNEAQRIACGAPDLSLRKGGVPIGHIETKDIGTNLDEVERGRGPHGKQFVRYRDGLPNWVLTDYLRFDWYVAGEIRKSATLATLEGNNKLKAIPGGEQDVHELLRALLLQPAITIDNAKELAQRMAGTTHLLREAIESTFHHGSHEDIAWLNHWVASIRQVLIPELKEDEFADMFAQTLAYGLFAARMQTAKIPHQKFSRETALLGIPKSNPFLRSIFSQMAGPEMPDVFAWAVDDLIRLLAHADIGGIIADFGHATGQDDPVVHFYETFLAAYDPDLRETRGVYYTPEAVVQYIVRSVHSMLKSHFGKTKGLADESTIVLDPATGTATFLFFVIRQIKEVMAGQEGAWPSYVHDHLLNRIFGFELLMAPYSIAHLKLALELEETKGFKFKDGERLGIYLTNTLEKAAKKSELLVAQAISKEADDAAHVKADKPILVILGNPPYSGHSANRSRDSGQNLTFIGGLIEDYKKVDGGSLGERNPKWLQDDYVKFIRFSQWRIETVEPKHGILAFITNHSYLDNPTFRGMRQNLMSSFDEIHVYDLHGNSKKKEVAPGGEKDENVFDIQQGVAILLAVRKPVHSSSCRVYHADLWGNRTAKYVALQSSDVTKTTWAELTPATPDYLFVPKMKERAAEYAEGISVTQVFPVSVLGFQSHRDHFAIAFEKASIVERAKDMRGSAPDDELRTNYDIKDNRDWKLADERKRLKDNKHWEDTIREVAYRPFDTRWSLFGYATMDYPRKELLQHVAGRQNLCLNTVRQTKGQQWRHALVSDKPAPAVYVELKDGSTVFPLWRYDGAGAGNDGLFARRPNLSDSFLQALAHKLGLPQDAYTLLPNDITAEDIFHYIYAVFHSPGFQSTYFDFLKRDFPRVPLTSDLELFRSLSTKGRELVALHLFRLDECPQLGTLVTGFPVEGDNRVDRVEYVQESHSVWINDTQHFTNVPEHVWSSCIGGYPVCEKWLKDRKDRKLSYDDTQHWQQIVVVLIETQRLMDEIDDAIPQWPLP